MAHNALCAKARGKTCNCSGCGGSRHGWPGCLALARDSPGERAARRERAERDWYVAVGSDERTRCANLASPTPEMLAHATEAARVEIAEYLARCPLEADRVEKLGDSVSEEVFPHVRGVAVRYTDKHPDMARIAEVLPGHFWCALLAALASAVGRVDHAVERVPDSAKELLEESPPPDWGPAQGLIADTALETVWECASGLLTGLRSQELLLTMRILGVFVCPDPVRHAEIARLCLIPLGKDVLGDGAARLLQQSYHAALAA